MKLPNTSSLIGDTTRSTDTRGNILSIVDLPVKNVSIIKCNAGSIRSNHYHKTDWHLMYVLEGKIDYFYKSLDDDIIRYLKVEKEMNIFTPALEIHATYFPIATKLLVSSCNTRDQVTYENDTVRVKLVDINNLNILLEKFA